MGCHVLFELGFMSFKLRRQCASVYTADLIGEAWNVRIAQNCRFEINEQNNTVLTSPRCFFHVTYYWISVNYCAQHLQSIQPHNKTYRPPQHVGSTQPVDTDSVPTHRTVRHDGFSLQAVAKETEKVAGLIGLYKNHAHFGGFIKVELPQPMRMR